MSMMAASTTNLVFRYELHQFVIPNVHPTGRLLRRGLYVNAEELKINGRIRVGKKFHSAVESEGVGILRISAKYAEGCQLMSSLRHPNIVQFIGLCFLPDYSLPVFSVMEGPWTNLGSLLAEGIPLTTKLSILIDIARGLVYLHNHNPPIVHSQLHVESVLLDNDMVAKISDLEDTLILNLLSNKHRLYMSRLLEVLGNEACGPKCDIFSFGDVALFTIQYHPWVRDDLPHDFLGTVNAALSCYVVEHGEIQRHYRYILKHSEGHHLVQLVKVCLSEEASCRPSADEVLQQLEAVLQAPCEYLTELDDFLRDTVDPELSVSTVTQSILNHYLRGHFIYQPKDIPEMERSLRSMLTRSMLLAKLPKQKSSAGDADLEAIHADLEALPADLEAIPAEVAHHECPICFVALDDDLHVTTCGHRFCHDCITRSLEQSHQCPICRRDLSLTLQDPPNYTRRILSAEVHHVHVEDQHQPLSRIQRRERQRIRRQTQHQPQPRIRGRERQRPHMECDTEHLMWCGIGFCCLIFALTVVWCAILATIGEFEDCPSNDFTTTIWILLLILLSTTLCVKLCWITLLDNHEFWAVTCLCVKWCVSASVPFLGLLIAKTVYVAEESDAIFGGYYTDNHTVIPCELNLYSAPISVVGGYVFSAFFGLWTAGVVVVALLLKCNVLSRS